MMAGTSPGDDGSAEGVLLSGGRGGRQRRNMGRCRSNDYPCVWLRVLGVFSCRRPIIGQPSETGARSPDGGRLGGRFGPEHRFTSVRQRLVADERLGVRWGYTKLGAAVWKNFAAVASRKAITIWA